MCGIIAVLGRDPTRTPPDPGAVRGALDDVAARLGDGPDAGRLEEAARLAHALDRSLRGLPGLRTLLDHADLAEELERRTAAVEDVLSAFEAALDGGARRVEGA